MDLSTASAQGPALPSQPRTLALLMSELMPEQPHLRRVNQLFACDPALAGRLLCQANTLVQGTEPRIGGTAQALALLDVGQLRTLAASAVVGGRLRAVPGVDLRPFWRCSLHAAQLARSLAGLLHLDPLLAYTTGLLHAVGELALHLADPPRLQALNALAPPLDLRRARLEQHLLGGTYAQASADLAQQWQLPEAAVQALRQHAAPLEQGGLEPLAGVLHLAVWRARAGVMQLDSRDLAGSFPGEVGVLLGLDIDMVLQQDPIDWGA